MHTRLRTVHAVNTVILFSLAQTKVIEDLIGEEIRDYSGILLLVFQNDKFCNVKKQLSKEHGQFSLSLTKPLYCGSTWKYGGPRHQKYKGEEKWDKWLLGLTSYHQQTMPSAAEMYHSQLETPVLNAVN